MEEMKVPVTGFDEIIRMYEELRKGYEKLNAIHECQNLISKYCYYQAASQQEETVALFATLPDTSIERMGGVYIGSEGIRRCFIEERPDRRNKDDERLIGYMHVETTSTPVLEVAKDGKTCRGAWICPGIETTNKRGDVNGYWNWYKFASDFILEEGKWKIWHMHLYKVFMSPYDTCWTEVKPLIPGVMTPEMEKILPPGFKPPNPDKPATTFFGYTPESIYPDDQPRLPEPYRDFSDVKDPY